MKGEEKIEYSIDFNSVWPYIPIILLFVLYIIISIGYSTGSTNAYLPWASVVVVSGAVLMSVAGLFLEHIHKAWVSLWILANQGEEKLIDALTNENNIHDDSQSDIEQGVYQSANRKRRSAKKKTGDEKGLDYSDSGMSGNIKVQNIFQTSRTLNLMPSAAAFISWLAYGILFRKYPTGELIPQLLGVIWIIWLVALQSRMIASFEPFRKALTVVFYIGIIFFPSDAGIATKLPWYTLLVKMTIMYVLFLLLSSETEVILSTSPAIITRKLRIFYRSSERNLTQSVWVLFVPTIFTVFAILQIGFLIWRIFRKQPDWDKKTDAKTISLHENRKEKKRKKDKKKKKRRSRHNTSTEDYYSEDQPQYLTQLPAIMPTQFPHQHGGSYVMPSNNDGGYSSTGGEQYLYPQEYFAGGYPAVPYSGQT